jgi:hypothetical protein
LTEPRVGVVLVVALLELAQDVQEVALVPVQRSIEQFAAAGLYPSFHNRVHSRCLDASPPEW